MLISLKWLNEFVALDVEIDELCARLTMLGLEIEAVTQLGGDIVEVYVGQIQSIEPHPNADNLVVCKTDVGRNDSLQIICGASNMKVGDKVPTAIIGATLPGDFKIGKRKMRGLESQGMMCSPQELGLGEDHGGLMILDGDATVGEDIRATLDMADTVLEIEVTPNRNDWSSMIGVARELTAAYAKILTLPQVTLNEGDREVASLSSVTIEEPELCPRYIGRVIENVKIGPSPDWLVRRLEAAGQRAINNVVDATNLVMLETGQPLHAFDFDRLSGHRIVVRRASLDEKLKTIDGETCALDTDMLVIADDTQPVAIAGVMGGLDSEVGEGTSNILLESAYFEPSCIRRTARALNLLTESAQRFQRGADINMAPKASERVAQLIVELAGGQLARGELDEYPKPLEPLDLELRYSRTESLLGVSVPSETQTSILVSLGFEIVSTSEDHARIRVPTWRPDVTHETDLIEEVARLYGYDRLKETLPQVRFTGKGNDPSFAKLNTLRSFLTGTGLTEILSWSFSSQQEVAKCQLRDGYKDMVTLLNPLSENYATMRTTLIPGLLAAASFNLSKNRGVVKSFEIGPVYRKTDASQELPDQFTRLGVVLAGASNEKHWSRPQFGIDIFDLKGYAELILDFFGVEGDFTEGTLECFSPSERGSIQVAKNTIGHLGRLCENAAAAYELDAPVYVLELDLDSLLIENTGPAEFSAIPAFPPSYRDLAVVVDRGVPCGEIRQIAFMAGGKYLQQIRVFDLYTGEQVPEGKKSVAMNLVFQSSQRTLTDKDTEKAWNKIVKRLEKEVGAELR